MTKVCNTNRDDWDLRIPTVLWAYRTTYKMLTRHTPFKLSYGQEVVVPMEYIIPSLKVATLIDMVDEDTVNERLLELVGLEDDCFIAGFHQQVQKESQKAWHDKHIKRKAFKEGDLVILYDNKFAKFLGKFRMHWLGPYQVKHVKDGGAIQLVKLRDEMFPTLVNGSRLKIYEDNPPIQTT